MKDKSTILKETMALFIITLLSGLALSSVYEITKGPIEIQAEEKKIKAYQEVYADAKDFQEDQKLLELAREIDLADISPDYSGLKVDNVNMALDTEGNKQGYVIELSTNKGYNGNISIVMGYSIEGTVQGIETLEINETAGLGSKASEPDFKAQFSGKRVDGFVPTNSGATADNEINAISGATVTTSAIVDVVNAGIDFLNVNSQEIGGVGDE